MNIKNPYSIKGTEEQIQTVLRVIAGQNGHDGSPYDEMEAAAEYIESLEETIESYDKENTRYRDALDKLARLSSEIARKALRTDEPGYDEDKVLFLQKAGHTFHCAMRIETGDGECECNLTSKVTPGFSGKLYGHLCAVCLHEKGHADWCRLNSLHPDDK